MKEDNSDQGGKAYYDNADYGIYPNFYDDPLLLRQM